MRKSIISNANNNNNNFINEINLENKDNNEINDNNNDLIQNEQEELLVENKQKNNNIKLDIKNNENEILLKEGEDSNKNKDNSEELNNNNNHEDDELDELIKLIKTNLSIFKIEFNLNEELHDNLSNIKKQYEEIIQVNKLKNKLFLKDKNTNINLKNANNININSNNMEHNEGCVKKEKIEDLSVTVLCELLSLSNPKIDFSCIKTNFYFRENKDNSLYRLKNILENMNEGNIVENIDIINIEKLQNALEHYTNNIHDFWKNYYELQKNKDEI